MHPVLIAAQAAMLERLAEGRFILGISPGALTTDAEALGILDEDCNKMFAEAIDVILEIWSREAPYNIDLSDNRFKVSTARSAALELGVGYLSKLYQNPRPEIVGTVLAPSWRRSRRAWLRWVSSTSIALSANFLLPLWIASHWKNYAEGKAWVGQVAKVFRMARRAHDLCCRRRRHREALRLFRCE
jgi:hypothetical protein